GGLGSPVCGGELNKYIRKSVISAQIFSATADERRAGTARPSFFGSGSAGLGTGAPYLPLTLRHYRFVLCGDWEWRICVIEFSRPSGSGSFCDFSNPLFWRRL